MAQNTISHIRRLGFLTVTAVVVMLLGSISAVGVGSSYAADTVDAASGDPPGDQRAAAALKSLQKYLKRGDYQSAFPLVRVMAEKGYLQYQTYLAQMYADGRGTRKNLKEAADWYQVAAKRGSREAQSQLGRMYFQGIGVPQSFENARRLLEQSSDVGESALLLGKMYADGLGTEKNYEKAIEYFKRADSAGVDAKIVIGILYSLGGFGVEKNFTQAKKWLEDAAIKNNSMAQCALGFVYYEGGHGIKKDLDKAKQYIVKSKPSLEKKAASGIPTAQTWLGRIYYLGLFQAKDYVKARKMFEASGDGDSLYALGVMQKKGQGGFRKDYRKAMDLFKRADQAGAFPAKVSIGELYYAGLGVAKNVCEAKKWFEQAARNEDPVARYYLGIMHANGECVKKDIRRAKMFFEQAKLGLEFAQATNEDCAEYLRVLNTDYQALTVEPADEAPSYVFRSGGDQQGSSTVTATTTNPPSGGSTPTAVAGGPQYGGGTPSANSSPNVASTTNVASVVGATTGSIPRVNVPTNVESKTGSPLDFKAVCGALQNLVIEYYPRAKITQDSKSAHFEFKVKSLKLPNSNKVLLIPDSEGFVCDITILPGRYTGSEYLPMQANETYYVSLLMAPYSTPADSHMLTRILFPPSTSVDFVNRFKQLVNRYQ